MNKYSNLLGLHNTNFCNSHGLDTNSTLNITNNDSNDNKE